MKKICAILCICNLFVGSILVTACSTTNQSKQLDMIEEHYRTIQKSIVVDYDIIKENAYRVDWSPCLNLIVFDKQQSDGYNDVFLMNPDGTGEICLTETSLLPKGHKGCAAWHPSGEYIVFTCQKEKYFGSKISILKKWLNKLGVAGEGLNCDLWVMTKDGDNFWQLTNLPTKQRFFDRQPYTGIIHPHFSHDGTKLLWTERKDDADNKWGEWTINIADFLVENNEPKLGNIQVFQPGDTPCFYESHGFSLDDKKIIFSGNLIEGQDENHLDIYTLDLETEELVGLTNSLDEWDEHAHYSPDGLNIVWMSSDGFGISTRRDWWNELKTEYWMMKSDGTSKTKITFYNENVDDNERIICSDCSWNAEGTKLATTMLIVKGEERFGGIAILDFSNV